MARVALLVALAAMSSGALTAREVAQPLPATDSVEQALRALVRDAGASDPAAPSVGASAPATIASAGLTRSGRRLWAIEPSSSIEPTKPRLVLIGGLDGRAEGTAAVLRVLEWWFTAPEAESLRGQWHIAALPCARPDFCGDAPVGAPDEPLAFPPSGGFFDGKLEPTPHHVWRWTTMQAPTVVVDLRVGWPLKWEANPLAVALVKRPEQAAMGSLAGALGASATGAAWSAAVPALQLTVRPQAAAEAVRDLARQSVGAISPLRVALTGRMSRAPLDVARMLAPRYPAQPIMSYIPALSWSGALRLARITGETRYRAKPLADMAPFLAGKTPAIAEPYLLTSLAGHLAFADLGAIDNNAEAEALARKAADFILPQGSGNREQGPGSGEIVRFPRAWTDDMFMATSVLARVAARAADDDRHAAAVGRLLTTYATDLQRPDGIFIHAKEGPHAWGRGNGFAAFGLMEALTYLPATWADRPRVLWSYRALMQGLVPHQAADGMWRQVIDEPGSYREFTVTAMVLTAMARGVRLGWIDGTTYRPVVDRAWRGLLARIAEDGTLMDVCTGTGSGPTKDYYLTRAGLTGPDDRGGAMGLTAALEMHELTAR
jgi:rhamnogalacturonyl hydrolase YesR